VPRDRDGSFEPRIVKKRQRRLAGVDELVISLAAKGLTTGEIAAHLADVYGAGVSRGHDLEDHRPGARGAGVWQSRPLDQVYPVVFIGAFASRSATQGRQPSGLHRRWYHPRRRAGHPRALVGDGSEGAKYWHQVLSEILDRVTVNVLIDVCDGLKGLPDAIGDFWPRAIVQTCVQCRLAATRTCPSVSVHPPVDSERTVTAGD